MEMEDAVVVVEGGLEVELERVDMDEAGSDVS
jgi:hypothetical protein